MENEKGSAVKNPELEQQIRNFCHSVEENGDKRNNRVVYMFPFLVSIGVFICQLFNTGILYSYSHDFSLLYDLLIVYMNETASISEALNSSTLGVYRFGGINVERIGVIEDYREELWSLFVAEVIELVLPFINICMFLWVTIASSGFPLKIKMIYVMAPTLAIVLSITQACMIQISLSDRIHAVRFILAKVISPLLLHNPNGSHPIEKAFSCSLLDDDELAKRNSTPSCSSVLHDGVVSSTTLDVVIFFHVVPLILFIYLLLSGMMRRNRGKVIVYVAKNGSIGTQNLSSNRLQSSPTRGSNTVRKR
ncbi:hypothetical protein AB6A40_001200 [Gnathostoma spinigerum]|uniref:Uncharacterized protein n=1 Tax=Gnathostoma spinigerum TaxID=75299 RepID=A0ABD6E5V0_9BILA